MPNGDFTNPRYFQENAFLSNAELRDKYGYIPRISPEDYDTEAEYLAEKEEIRRLNNDEESD